MSASAATEKRTLHVALIGNPNTGKSTIFNLLSGGKSRIGNFPGVTVEKKTALLRNSSTPIELVDLPGTYSLAPRSRDEMVAVDLLLGRQTGEKKPDAVVCILDASNLERNLYLVSQVLDLRLPTILVLNMWDVALERGIRIDVAGLEQRLGLRIVTTSAHKQQGIAELNKTLQEVAGLAVPPDRVLFPESFQQESVLLKQKLAEWGVTDVPDYFLERLLLDVGGYLESHINEQHTQDLKNWLTESRERMKAAGCRIPMIEARIRYAWVREMVTGLVQQPETRPVTASDRIDRWLTHRWFGSGVFLILMFLVFQSIFSWAAPLQDGIEKAIGMVAGWVSSALPAGVLRSLVTDGVIAGVGGVLVFVPQIAILFLFIAILEDCGYLARAAFLMDKLMTRIGLSGKSFVPLMSSFACAIPGVMATRVIENRRDRMVTILIAPLMSCSARLPVYVLMIGAFIPSVAWLNGWLTLRGMVLFAMTFLGALVAIPVAWGLKKTFFRGETPPFVMELPGYKWPSVWIVFHRVYEQVKAFVTRAGTLILATSILIWAAGYFPGDHRPAEQLQAKLEKASESEQETLQTELNALNAELLRTSYLGRFGRSLEPVVKPLGWDWKIGVGVLASFPAREVIIATLGTIYSLGGEVDEESDGLREVLAEARHPDGTPVFTWPVALSIMVFFALCAQCASTLVVIRRETGHWGWALFTFAYMTILAYLGAWIAFRVGNLFMT
ncbi:MAG: ferrous iron transport protein B [Planctomycetales bacterium]